MLSTLRNLCLTDGPQVTPLAEFNVLADSYAAARIYALTSADPSSTMPPPPLDPEGTSTLPPYPKHLSRPLNLTLFSLDITERHVLSRDVFDSKIPPLLSRGSPLAEWSRAFLGRMLEKMIWLHEGQDGSAGPILALHDPMCVWYVLTREDSRWTFASGRWGEDGEREDIRVETQGQWTKGMTLVDRRTRKTRSGHEQAPHDRGNRFGKSSGNRVRRVLESPGSEGFGAWMLDRILGSQESSSLNAIHSS